MSLIKKEMNLILNNLRSLKEYHIGSEMEQDQLLKILCEKELIDFIPTVKDSLAQAALKQIHTKCKDAQKLIGFSKTQILYEKNLKLMSQALETAGESGIDLSRSSKHLKEYKF